MRPGKHASLHEWQAVTQGFPDAVVADRLRVDRRTVRDWASGRRPIPWWAPALLMLDDYVTGDALRQIGGRLAVLGMPSGGGNALRVHLERAVQVAVRDAMRLGLVGASRLHALHVPRQTLEAKRSSDSSDERGLTTG